jgi:Uncharacterized protein involved in exopolysaccharide biosynthesis
MENNHYQDSIYFFGVVAKYWKFIFYFTLAVTIISTIVAFLLPKWYAATTNLVPSSSSQEGSGIGGTAISSALKEFGLTKMTGASGGEQYSYIVILQSRTVIDSIINKYHLDQVYDIPKKEMVELREEFLDNLEVSYEKEGNYTITVWDTDPQRAADIANDMVQIANAHFVNIYRQDSRLSKEYFELRVNSIDSSLTEIGKAMSKFTKKTLLFSPEDQAQAIAKSLSDLKAEQVKYDIIYNFYKSNYGDNDPLAKSFKSMSEELNQKLNNLKTQPGFAGNFALNDASAVAVEYIRLYTDFETLTKVKAFLVSMLEKIRSDEVKSIQSLLVVDKAIPPDKKDKPKRAYIIIGSAIGGLALALLIAFSINYYREIKTRLNQFNNVEE